MEQRQPQPPLSSTPLTSYQRLPWALCTAIILLQCSFWAAGVTGGLWKAVLAALEMALLGGLLWNGWRIHRWVYRTSKAQARSCAVADLTVFGLAVCLLGDAVNRNVPARFYSYDNVVQHSYLADSVWFFFPGYALLIAAVWLATAGRVSPVWRALSLAVAAAGGGFAFSQVLLPGTATYIAWLTGAYSVLIALMLPCALWIWLAFGRSGRWVALGAALATAADGLIGQFWLYGSGYYPGIAYANFMLYFVSQALLQQLPLLAQNSYSSTPRRV
ncbi:hypothetical protein [Haliea sp.]|jgi:hypothetical protein|uniref:hypothetical protein n=1 Tax=Haliea TaxID=475794 RepID=UPI000C61D759|nr:hypothetical protein [Haliea sp.]HBX72074.1 hypothetical protein [Halieaceae bacterium]MAD63495.1 hypothetical protein [Haliea sp.]MAY93437.1 hypothetical protein [Haliea sp.]MBK41196.1 hypothetical protein [Haliea sp.]MBP71370.1 hypothetical protein [Haliea sp.]|tara:strand:- start:2060 stop:2881 length:822 start_codon:yes stop_codon:yes gene_type:complete